MLKWVFFSTFAAILGIAIYLFFYLGGYKTVTISEISYPELRAVYRIHRGAYHKVGPVIEEVEKWAQRNNVLCHKTFGEYLDNPSKVEESRLRSNVGCLVDRKIDPLPKDYFYRVFNPQLVVKAEFQGAPSIGPFKVYPAVSKYLLEKRLKSSAPPIEIYQTLPDGSFLTEFIFALDTLANEK